MKRFFLSLVILLSLANSTLAQVAATSIYVPRVAYYQSFDSNGVLLPTTPLWDWLIGVVNPYTAAQTVGLHFFDGTSGTEVGWSPCTFTLQPGTSMAASLIPGNGLVGCTPAQFSGYVRVDFPNMTTVGPFGPITTTGVQLPFASAIGGNGPGGLNWNYGIASADPIGSTQVDHGKMMQMVWPYAIPFYMDPLQHAGQNEYRTSLSITNLDTVPAKLAISYTVDVDYPNAGTTVTANVTIVPGAQYNVVLGQLFPAVMTYNQKPPGQAYGSEGWINVTSATPVNLMAWELESDRDFNLQLLSFRPWIIK